jgi:hypothetical protein
MEKIIVWSALGIAVTVNVLLKNRVRPQWRTYSLQWREAMPVWWSILWRATFYGVVGGHFLGDAARIIAIATGHSDIAGTSGRVANWFAALLCSIGAVKEALQIHVGRLTGAVAVPPPAA